MMHRGWRATVACLCFASVVPTVALASPPAYRVTSSQTQLVAPTHSTSPRARLRPHFVITDDVQTLGTFSMLVVPVAFSDMDFGDTTAKTSDIQAYLGDMVFGTDSTGEGLYPYPSMRQYYLDQSRGQFVIEGEVAATITLANPAAYYAQYNNGNSDGCFGLGTYFSTGDIDSALNGGTTEMIREVLTELDDIGVDLTRYSNGSDLVLDGIIFIHVGPGGETASSAHEASGCDNPAGDTTMWSHVLERTITVNGTPYDTALLTSAETFLDARNDRELPSGIGTLAHEFGHVLGLPDLYDLSTMAPGYGVGHYSIMGHGLYDSAAIAATAEFGPDFRPKNMDPYLRHKLGWLDVPHLTDNRCFEAAAATPAAEQVWRVAASADASEYFLLEFRGQQGWDADLPAAGMLVWHIDEAKNGQQDNCIPSPNSNCRSNHYEVAVVQRDGRYGLEARESWMDAGDYYIPGTFLDDKSIPGFTLYAGRTVEAQASMLQITDAVFYSHLAGDPDSLPLSPDRIGPQPPIQAAVGVPYQWDATIESNGLPVQFTLLDAPQGMTVDTRWGQVRWTPDAVGQVPFTLTAQSCTGSIGRTVLVDVTPSPAFMGDINGLDVGAGCTCSLSQRPLSRSDLLSWFLALGLWLGALVVLRHRITTGTQS